MEVIYTKAKEIVTHDTVRLRKNDMVQLQVQGSNSIKSPVNSMREPGAWQSENSLLISEYNFVASENVIVL